MMTKIAQAVAAAFVALSAACLPVPSSSEQQQQNVFGDDDGDECRTPPTDIPATLAPPVGECLRVAAHGVGVQIYTCDAGAQVLKAPEADLVRGRVFVGNHFLGPAWQWRDGSKVHAAKTAAAPAPNASADIPWLLLGVTTHDGRGRLAGILHVQRVHTSGGVAPSAGDGGPCAEGTETRVPYEADYLFYGPLP